MLVTQQAFRRPAPVASALQAGTGVWVCCITGNFSRLLT